ncbi:MAG TPA: peptide chain release factor N(5)-glutamine methyltransferase [Paludibacteraceae bacterium]|nr:peptide chain release factor N(5)-glutamine methyltransferase [Paludibacteraceae bacterium]
MPTIINHIQSELKDFYPEGEVKAFTRLLLEKVAGWTLTDILTHDDLELSDEQTLFIHQAVERLKEHEPIQYILGETEFNGMRFWVDNRVLIPRPETEELIEWITEVCQHPNPSILDIGTGSGCIAIALANKFRKAKITGFDISLDALHAANENAELNNVLIGFFHVNILKIVHWEDSFDVIVSNPPYVLNSERAMMEENVLAHEPEIALFVTDDDPLIFYRHIGQFALQHLKKEGQLFLEINQALGKETVRLLKEIGFKTVELRKDLSGKNRMIRAMLTGTQ